MGKDLMHTACVCMANTISRKIRLHIMNEKWVQTLTCIHTYTVLQGKLVLINLAGGTRHVFPVASWPVPWVAQWKPSILVCLQFVCLNFVLICIIHWWPLGLVQEVPSEDCRGIYFTRTSYIMLSFSLTKRNCVSQSARLPLPSALKNKSFCCLEVVQFFISFYCFANDCVPSSILIRAAEGEDYQREPWKHWGGAQSICDYGGQMFFSHTASAHCSLSPPWQFFCFSQYQRAHRSWVHGKRCFAWL